MPIREIIQYPHPILRNKCKRIENLNGRIHRIVEDLRETMYSSPGGIGISAPQIGKLSRIVVVDASRSPHYKKANHGRIILINPVIIHTDGEKITREGCMSIPEYVAFVKRAREVVVRGWTLAEREIEIEARNLEAVALQHEIDHLEGILFIDRIASPSELIPRNILDKR